MIAPVLETARYTVMKIGFDYSNVTAAILSENGDEAAEQIAGILAEADESAPDVTPKEVGSTDYLFKFDEFLADAGVYAYEGWLDAEVTAEPVVGRFWVDFYLRLPKGFEPDGAKQIPGPNGIAKVTWDDSAPNNITISVLRKSLDEIEERNRTEAFRDSQAMAKAKQKEPSIGDGGPPQ